MTLLTRLAAAGAIALLATGCGIGARSAYMAPSSDVTEVRVESLLDADRAFAARAREVGAAAAFADFMAADGTLLGATDQPVVGTDAITAVMGELPPNSEISWTPIEAMVADSGELGFTWGEYRLVLPGADGAPAVEETGRYVTVWRKDENGRWRGVLDIGT